ncbi:MAG: PQQ-dependent sugar dehydrogenase [Propionibacteriales bacterium]|nr:PQQ-dependent sugar dehydrogenase [Propionibacteriales bacterium]
MKPPLPTTIALAGALALLAACGSDPQKATPSIGPTTAAPVATSPATTGSVRTPAPKVIGTVARNLEVPWGIDFLPDGSALVTERDSGRILQIAGSRVAAVGTIDETRSGGEAGLLGLAVSPSYATDKLIYVYASTDADNRVLRVRFAGGRLSGVTPVLTGIPRGFIHDGGRLAFGPDGYLYVSTGESGNPEIAQDKGSLGGKILRITTDGAPAPGNPDPSSPVWSLGHRNVQGIAFDGAGRLWASEFGQNTFDELNLIEAGTNYGWPAVEGRATSDENRTRFRDPQVVWETQDASPSGLAFVDGHLWMASLRGQRLWRIAVGSDGAADQTDFFVGDYGRMRTVVVAPDGNLWVTTSNRDGRGDPQGGDDRILLVDPGTS